MSGRIRSIKPEWLEDEKLVLASSDARVLSIALILLADDYGNGRANRVMLAGRVFPGKVLETLENALAELTGWFVVLYEVGGQRYFSLPNWDKHQKVDKPGKPRVPGPSEALAKVPETLENTPAAAANPRASRASRSYVPDPGPGPDTGPAPERESRVVPATLPEPVAKPPEQPASGTHRTAQPKPAPREPRNLEEALLVPVCERAQLVTSGRVAAMWLEPQKWPEVVAVAEALAAGEGRAPMPLGAYDRDNGVKAVVGLYADGFMPGDVKRVARQVPTESWWRSGDGRRGLASLTPEVVRRAMAGPANVGATELLARADAELAKATRGKPADAPTALGDLLGKVAAGGLP